MKLKIIFMGTPNFAVPILKSLNDSKHQILTVYTQTPKKKDRGQKINISPIHSFSNKNNLKVRCPETLNNDDEIDFIKKIKPDVVIVVAYGKILPSKLLDIKNIKFINIHASLLPKWRGAAPIHRAIMNQDNETGVSIMEIVPKLDSGPVMMKSKINITENMNYKDLSDQMSKLGAKMILDSLRLLSENNAKFVQQNEEEATYANKISKSETEIDWREDASKIIAKINALNPNPCAWFKYNKQRYKIWSAKLNEKIGKCGEILDDNLLIGCKNGSIRIEEIQKEGKLKMTAKDFQKGNNLKMGTFIK